ncbi:hypothetical protein CP98_04360 [Sphingobium yanoikuyae]|uniref:Uncharacterized protein n=1 Tax=Sphingobium yanoikuyae TaxID=13690 RepID=A0A084ECF8_SPHYA|nr:hypothetical protein CP98_04360 [Sphingobium yanoikuyae]
MALVSCPTASIVVGGTGALADGDVAVVAQPLTSRIDARRNVCLWSVRIACPPFALGPDARPYQQGQGATIGACPDRRRRLVPQARLPMPFSINALAMSAISRAGRLSSHTP